MRLKMTYCIHGPCQVSAVQAPSFMPWLSINTKTYLPNVDMHIQATTTEKQLAADIPQSTPIIYTKLIY